MQHQIREIVAYRQPATSRPCQKSKCLVKPVAVSTAYQLLSNSDIPNDIPKGQTSWGLFPYMHAPKEENFDFLEDVLREVMTTPL